MGLASHLLLSEPFLSLCSGVVFNIQVLHGHHKFFLVKADKRTLPISVSTLIFRALDNAYSSKVSRGQPDDLE